MTIIASYGKSILEVDLNRIIANYDFMESIHNNSEMGVVVKADAYGVGMLPVAKALYNHGCNSFFVAYVREALLLRKSLSAADIYVLHGIQNNEAEIAVKQRLIPVLNDFGQVETWQKQSKKVGCRLPAMLHIDTGMNRLGLSNRDVEKFIANKENFSGVEIQYIMSHPACASQKDHMMNIAQITQIKKYQKEFNNIKVSYANSAAVLLGKEYQFDLTRVGCALYGLNQLSTLQTPLQQVIKVKAEVMQIRTMEKDQPVSYGATYIAKKGDRIATIAYGYADGYPRLLSNNGHGYYKGYKLPVVGIVTMDMIMLDVSDVPEQELAAMKYVEMIGDNISVDEIAMRANTINYEVLTSIGNRLQKVYKIDKVEQRTDANNLKNLEYTENRLKKVCTK